MALMSKEIVAHGATLVGTAEEAPSLPRRESGEYTQLMEMVAGREGVEAVEMLERLVALKERAEDRDAERAIIHAVAGFKAELAAGPPIPKDGEVDYVDTKGRRVRYRHTKLPTVCKYVDPILPKYGLSYTWDSLEPTGSGLGRVTICTLHHVDGAKRTARFDAPPSGAPTSADVQKVGAALMYGQRYTLIMVLGLVATMDDVDGTGPKVEDHGPPVSEEHLASLVEWVESTESNLEKFLAFMGVEKLADIPEARYEYAVGQLKAIGEARKARASGE